LYCITSYDFIVVVVVLLHLVLIVQQKQKSSQALTGVQKSKNPYLKNLLMVEIEVDLILVRKVHNF
jgi:hypothetical protein